MSSEPDFPRSPLRDFDPFGRKSGVNPFADQGGTPAPSTEGEENIFAASTALAKPTPPVEYEAVLQPRVIVMSGCCGTGFAAATLFTLMLLLWPFGEEVRLTFAILFLFAMAFFLAGLLISRGDLRAIRKGAMKREQEALVWGLGLLSGLGLAYSTLMAFYCFWPTLLDLSRHLTT